MVTLSLNRGQFEIDELFLRREKGVTDFSRYVFQTDSKNPKQLADEDLDEDFFVPDTVWDEVKRQRAGKPKL
jgi:hypothetical protein